MLPCPECRMNGRDGKARIGHQRNRCATCNNWAQAVLRQTRKRLKEKYPDLHHAIRMEVELDLYPGVLDDFRKAYPSVEVYRERAVKPKPQRDERPRPEHPSAPGIDLP